MIINVAMYLDFISDMIYKARLKNNDLLKSMIKILKSWLAIYNSYTSIY